MRTPLLITVGLLLPLSSNAQPVKLLVDDLPIIGTATGLAEYLDGLFKLGISIAIAAAVVLFVYYGIVYMTSDVITDKGKAKAGFKSILYGLIIAFSAVLILNLINPEITKFNFLSTLGGVGEPSTTPPPNEQEQAVRDQLRAGGVEVKASARVGDLPQSAIQGVINLKSACGAGCDVTITSGTEGSHQTHGAGKPMVDLRRSPNITNYIRTNGQLIRSTCIGNLYGLGGNEYLDETAGAPHWHSCFGQACQFRSGC